MIFQGYLIFPTTSAAFVASRALASPSFAKFGLVFEHCPAPREYSHDCTLAIYLESTREDFSKEEILLLSTEFENLLTQKEIAFKFICTSKKNRE